MLKSLHIENFKSWRSVDLEFGKITGIFGTNSSGKTSLLQFLLLLKQTREATDRGTVLELNGDYVALGGYEDLINNHQINEILSWGLEFDIKLKSLSDLQKIDNGRNYFQPISSKISASVFQYKNFIFNGYLEYCLENKYQYRFNREESSDFVDNASFDLILNKEATILLDSYLKSVKNEITHLYFYKLRTNFIGGYGFEPIDAPIKSYIIDFPRIFSYIPRLFASEQVGMYENQMDNIFYIGPLRDFPKRDYLWSGSAPVEVGAKGEKTIDAILANTLSEMRKGEKNFDQSFIKEISNWLNRLGLINVFTIERISYNSNRWQILIKINNNSNFELLPDVGFGVSQILPVITQLFYAPKGSTVILEQPEIHLHPKAQAELADLIIEAAYTRNIQIIVESHSEHFLLRLQRRMAEKQEFNGKFVDADGIKLYFCDMVDGESKLTKLDLDEYGTIHNWPKNFMGDAFTEAAETAKARIKRRKEKK